MIVGVSHIVLGSSSLEDDVHLLGGLGYDVGFVEKGLPTHPGKRPYMTGASEGQALALCYAPSGPALELIAYGSVLGPCSSPLQLAMSAAVPPETSEAPLDPEIAAAWRGCFGSPLSAALVRGIVTPLLFAASGEGAGTILHRVGDLAAARAFWSQLGWASPKGRADAGAGWSLLAFSSAAARWRASLLLVESASPVREAHLDTAGFRCLSFVTTSLERDGEVLRRAGTTRSTGRMEYVINGKPLALEIFAGPDGVMIELLELVRGAR
jgi:hypothetical protein